VFAFIFLAEMIIKLIGLGPKEYVRDNFNKFDGITVVLTTVEQVIDYGNFSSISTGGAISAFRAVRLLRVLKLARSWTSFQVIIKKIGDSLQDIVYFSLLLFLFLYISALLGMELFAGRVVLDGETPRENFNDFLHAFTTVFIVIIGDVSATYNMLRIGTP